MRCCITLLTILFLFFPCYNSNAQSKLRTVEFNADEFFSMMNKMLSDVYETVKEKDINGMELNRDEIETLDSIAELLKQNTSLSLRIKGYVIDLKSSADKTSHNNSETQLVDVAKSYLINKGISAERVSTAYIERNETSVDSLSRAEVEQEKKIDIYFTIND